MQGRCWGVSRDIRNFVRYHRSKDMHSIVGNHDLDAIFHEGLEYTGKVTRSHWMEGSLVGVVVTNLFNIVVYIYSEETKACYKNRKRGKAKKQGDEVGGRAWKMMGGMIISYRHLYIVHLNILSASWGSFQ